MVPKPFNTMTDKDKLAYVRDCVLTCLSDGADGSVVESELADMARCLGVTDADVAAFEASCGGTC